MISIQFQTSTHLKIIIPIFAPPKRFRGTAQNRFLRLQIFLSTSTSTIQKYVSKTDNSINLQYKNILPQKMFRKVYSFKGRIRRKEYFLSLTIYLTYYILLTLIFLSEIDFYIFYHWLLLLGIYFVIVQSAKRCHDLGNSGWYQLIPFYVILLLFQDGIPGTNKYGENPKGK